MSKKLTAYNTVWTSLQPQESGHYREVAIVERLKQEWMYGLSTKKNGCCREVAISGVLTVVVNLLFHIPVTFWSNFKFFPCYCFTRKYITLIIWTENQAVYLLSEACNRFLIHSCIQGFGYFAWSWSWKNSGKFTKKPKIPQTELINF